LNLKDKYIALPGIIFPNIFGTITLFFSVISILYIKLTKNKFSYKLFSLNKTNLSLAYCLFHILIPFFFSINFNINAEFKSLVFISVSSLVLLINKRNKDIAELNFFIKVIISYLFLIAIYITLNKGIIFRFPDFNPLKYGLNSIYVGSLFVLIFALFEEKFIKISSFIMVLIAGSGTAITGLIIYISIDNFKKIKKSKNIKFDLKRIFFLIIFISLLIFIFFITQEQRGRSVYDFENVDRFILQNAFIKYWFQNLSITNFLFGSSVLGSLDGMIELIDSPIMSDYLLLKMQQSGGVLTGRMIHNEHFRIIFHFGIIGYGIFIRQIYLLIDRKKSLFVSFLWMAIFNPVVYANSTFVFLILISNYKLNKSNYIDKQKIII